MALEDFDTYTVEDPHSNLTVTANRIIAQYVGHDDYCWVVKDFGAGYFSGNFEHYFDAKLWGSQDGGWINFHALATAIGTYWDIAGANEGCIGLAVGRVVTPSPIRRMWLEECINGTKYASTVLGISNATYYCILKRDESIGTYGRLTCEVYTDPARTILQGPILTLNLHQAKQDFRYCYGHQSVCNPLYGNANAIDSDTLNLELIVPTIAPTVTTSPATSIEATTATGNGNITDNGGEDCDKRGFVYDTSPHGDPGDTAPADSEYADYVEETDSFGTGAFTGALTGLDPKTTYYVRAYAHNSAGYSYGNEVEFTTLVAIPAVTTNPASAVGQTTATLNGTLDDDGGEDCDCSFEYGETTDYGGTTATQSKTTGETFSQEVRGLNSGRVYHFRAVATNSAGTSYGTDRTFHTEALSAEAHQALGRHFSMGRHGL